MRCAADGFAAARYARQLSRFRLHIPCTCRFPDGSSCTGTMNEVECIVVGMGERGTILVQSYEISYLSEPS